MTLVCGSSVGNQLGDEQERREERMNEGVATH